MLIILKSFIEVNEILYDVGQYLLIVVPSQVLLLDCLKRVGRKTEDINELLYQKHSYSIIETMQSFY